MLKFNLGPVLYPDILCPVVSDVDLFIHYFQNSLTRGQ